MYKVLLVDDEAIILKGLQSMINWSELGLELAGTASDGAEAMDIIGKMAIDIVITDIRMPDVDGLMLIRQIRERGLPIRCIVLSGYSEFEYVKEAARLGIENYILKPVDKNELISTLMNTTAKIENELSRRLIDDEGIEIIRNNILKRWIKGDIEHDDLYERAMMLGIDIGAKEYQVAVVKLMYENASAFMTDVEEGGAESVIDSIRDSLVDTGIYGELKFTMIKDGGRAILLYSAAKLEGYMSEMNGRLETMLEHITHHPAFSAVVAVGGIQQGYENVNKSYRAALKLLEHSLIYKKNSIRYHSNSYETAFDLKKKLQIDYSALNNAIKNKNQTVVQQIVQAVFDRMRSFEIASSSQIQEVTVDLLFYVINTIRTLNYNTDKVFSGYADMLSRVNQFSTIGEMELWMSGVVGKCMDILSDEDEKISPFIKRIIAYLNQNYASEINLSTIADTFGANSFYLGQQFKKETGETFTNYLNNIRIEQAKYLLLSSSMKTVDIARKVGYSNTNYFSTIFKKVAGCSPSEFLKGGA